MKRQSGHTPSYAFPATAGPDLGHRGAAQRRRVLTVDDSPEIRHLVSRFLHRHGYDVSLAENGHEAWQLFRRAPYDLVITDLQMPVMDGMALMARIQTLAPETPVVVITGQMGEAVPDLVGPDGPAQAVLHKPFAFNTLLKTMAALIDTEAAAAITITL